ncbi:MAG: SurA N-terminal domain-containing protein [Myxococcota bacterium]
MPTPRLLGPGSVLAASLLLLALPAAGQDALAGLIEEKQAPAADDSILLEGIAAQVGSDIVLVSEVRELEAPMIARAKAAGATDADLRRIEAQALERLIEKALLRIVVKRAELQASDEEIDGTISDIATDNGITPEQLRASVEAQGLPYSAYREKIKGEIEHSKVINGLIGSRVEIKPDEVQEIYQREFAARPQTGEEFHARTFVVTPATPKDADSACARVREARARVVAGEDLLDVANGIATMDPELGWVHESLLAPWIEAAVRPLAAGQSSEVSQEPFGCAFVQLVERRAVTPIAFEDAQRAIMNKLYSERLQGEYAKFIEELRAHTYIERKGTVASIEEFEPAAAPGG